jgi:hypothetical protein
MALASPCQLRTGGISSFKIHAHAWLRLHPKNMGTQGDLKGVSVLSFPFPVDETDRDVLV